MSHLTLTRWHGYATEPRDVVLTITSELSASQIASAVLRITDQVEVTLTPAVGTNGYLLEGDLVLPSAPGFYEWTAEVEDTDGNTPVVVAQGQLRVKPRTTVAAATP